MSLYLSIKNTNKLWEKYVRDTAFTRLILTQNNLHQIPSVGIGYP